MAETRGVGLIGLGTVGTGVVHLLQQRSQSHRPTDVGFCIRRVAVRDRTKSRGVDLDAGLLTEDPTAVIDDPSVDLVVELSGDAEARSWIARALDQGKDTVTANKAVVAEFGEELFDCALASGADLMFEASVAGGIPIIRSMRSGLAANRVESIHGILNGTTNYILTQMTRGTGDYWESLELAKQNGFAESDPTMDLNGMDAAQKLAILCRIAFGTNASGSEIARSGIEGISRADIEYATELGYVIKLLAIGKRRDDQIEARVHPAMISQDSVLANIHDEYNGIEVVGSAVGTQVFTGKGAGQMPTASAVVADMIEVAQRRSSGARSGVGDLLPGRGALRLADSAQMESRFYLRLVVADRPGVLELIAKILASQQISIASVLQKERDLQGGAVPLIIVTHEASEAAMQNGREEMNRLNEVQEDVQLIRIEAT